MSLKVNEKLPEVINVTIPFRLAVKQLESGGKSFPVYMRHAEYVATTKGEDGSIGFELGGTMGAGYSFDYKREEDCSYNVDAQTIMDAIVEAMEKLNLLKKD